MRTRALTTGLTLATVLVLTAACSGSSGSSGPSETPSASTPGASQGPSVDPSPSGSGVPDGPPAREAKGYTIVAAPETARTVFEGAVTASDGIYTGLSVYRITKNKGVGDPEVGGLVLFGVDPMTISRPDILQELGPGLVKTLTGSTEVATRTRSGLVISEASAGGTTFAAWYDGQDVALVIGNDTDEVTAFVDAYIGGS